MNSLRQVLAAVFLTASASAATAGIIVDDRDWSQPDLFSNYSYNEIASVCDLDTGLCSGQLSGGQDLTGYTWASVEDVNELFNSLLGADLLGPAQSSYSERASAWAPEALDLFAATNTGRNPLVSGLTRTERGRNRSYIAGVQDKRRNRSDIVFSDRGKRKSAQNASVGAWFFQEVQPVPSPASSALLLLGLAVLIIRRPTSAERI